MANFWALIQAIPALSKLVSFLFASYGDYVLAKSRKERDEQSRAEDVVLDKLKDTHEDSDLADLAQSLNDLRSPK